MDEIIAYDSVIKLSGQLWAHRSGQTLQVTSFKKTTNNVLYDYKQNLNLQTLIWLI